MIKKEIYIDKNTNEKLTKETYDDGDVFYNNIKTLWHRLDGPAIEYSDGTKEWYIDGKQYTELKFNIQVRKMKLENI